MIVACNTLYMLVQISLYWQGASVEQKSIKNNQ